MNIGTYFFALALLLTGMTGLLLFIRMRQLQAAASLRDLAQVDPSRYEPMQRLLSKDDLALVSSDKKLAGRLRAQRCHVVRGYLRCMTKDFGALHAGIRQMMVDAHEDQSELAVLLLRSKWKFLYSSCRIEASLWLYQAGIGTVDLSGLVGQLNTLGAFAPVPAMHAA